MSCGVVYGLVSGVCGLGKRFEERLIKKWGGMLIMIILRYCDIYLDDYMKV